VVGGDVVALRIEEEESELMLTGTRPKNSISSSLKAEKFWKYAL
jgi:hypothetical protein